MDDPKTEALKTIALMPTPYFTVNNQKWVKLETVLAMKQWAKDALGVK